MSNTPRSYDEICLDKTASPLERETALLREWKDTLLKASTLETQRDEARAEVERLRKLLESERDAVKRYIVTFQRRMPECWLEHFERAGCVTFDEIGFVKAAPVVVTLGQSIGSLAGNIAGWKPQPEIFEAHGREWYRHTPGDKMPCDGEMRVCVLWLCDDTESSGIDALAQTFNWDIKELRDEEIIGWRPADAPEKLQRK